MRQELTFQSVHYLLKPHPYSALRGHGRLTGAWSETGHAANTKGAIRLASHAGRRCGLNVLIVAGCLGLLAGCGQGATATTVVGTWKVTYGAATVVRIGSTGTDKYSMTARTPVQVVGGSTSCHLPVGTVLATFSGHGTSYTGLHGLWSRSNCSFASWTSVNLTVNGKTALAAFGDGESLTLTRVPAAAATSGDAWLWLVLVLVVVGAIAYLVVRRRRPARSGSDSP
jgi:hypothetical protein